MKDLTKSMILGLGLSALAAATPAVAREKPSFGEGARYVAMGSSFASGSGVAPYDPAAPVRCQRSTQNYAHQLARKRNLALVDVTCGGATTAHILGSWNELPPQIEALTADTALVTITIGGNDIGFTNLIIACTTFGCSSQIATSQNQINTQLPAKLDAAYNAIRAKSATAQVVVLGYGRPFATPPRTCLAATGVSSSEETSLTTLVDSLNNTIKTRALAHGFSYADVNPYWAGHDVCASNPFTNGLTLLHTADSYHPTRNGYANGDVPAIRAIIG